MRFTTPHGSVRYRLPWSWSSFDYRQLCQLLYAQSDARFQTAKVHGQVCRAAGGRGDDLGRHRPRRAARAAGRRCARAGGGCSARTALPASRGAAVAGPRGAPPGHGEDLDVWIERSLVGRGYGWRVPAAGEARVGVASYAPADHVRASDRASWPSGWSSRRSRYQGNWFPHRLRPATENAIFFAGDSAGHCFPLSGEGIRTALYFGIACGRELAAVLNRQRSRAEAIIALRSIQRTATGGRSRSPRACSRSSPPCPRGS